MKIDPTTLDLALQAPVLNANPGQKYDDDRRDYNMIRGIARTPSGRIWGCWVSGGDSEKAHFVLQTSDDDGQTWSKPRLVIDPPDAPNGIHRRILCGNVWCDPLGRLWLFFDQSMGMFDGRSGDWYSICANPDGDCPVWTVPVRIGNGDTHGKPIVLGNGDWLLPVALQWRGWMSPGHDVKDQELRESWRLLNTDLDAQRGAYAFGSSDQGRTWKQRGFVYFPHSAGDEHMFIEKRDGSLWMLDRTEIGIQQSFSRDQGMTWSKPSFAYPHTVSRFYISRLNSGNILFVRHGDFDGKTTDRSNLMAFLSDDDGATWKGGLVLDERSVVSYPDGFQAPDGRIFISYDRNRDTDAEILMATFTEEDVLAKRPVTKSAQLKSVINKATGKGNSSLLPQVQI